RVQSLRGLTPEEKAEARARLEAARTKEQMAGRDMTRAQALFERGFVSGQDLEHARSGWRETRANRQEQEEAWRRAELGTPAEELEQARQAHQQAKATLDLA